MSTVQAFSLVPEVFHSVDVVLFIDKYSCMIYPVMMEFTNVQYIATMMHVSVDNDLRLDFI